MSGQLSETLATARSVPQTTPEPELTPELAEAVAELQRAVQDLITEDDTPVDSLYAEKQQRLLTESLNSSWPGPGAGRPFLVTANVGLFSVAKNPGLAPDVTLSLDAKPPENILAKDHRSCYFWLYGKLPDVVIEIVSDTPGGEADEKLAKYAWMKISYYVIYDPLQVLSDEVLTVYRLVGASYSKVEETNFADIGLGLTLWHGIYEDCFETWLRWTDAQGNLIPTGKERAEQERIEKEVERAEKEHERAEKEAAQRRAEKLAARLRALGIDPDQL